MLSRYGCLDEDARMNELNDEMHEDARMNDEMRFSPYNLDNLNEI